MPETRTVFTRTFWYDAAERAVKTAAQSVILVWGLSTSGPVNAFEFDWELGAGAALGGAVLSVLFSVGSAPIGSNGTASAIKAPPGPAATVE
jgi:r1t holin